MCPTACSRTSRSRENCKGGQEFHVAVEIARDGSHDDNGRTTPKGNCDERVPVFFSFSCGGIVALVLEQLHVLNTVANQTTLIGSECRYIRPFFFCGMYPTSCRVSRVHVSCLRPENQRLGRKLITAPGGKIVLITSKMGSMADNTSGGAYG